MPELTPEEKTAAGLLPVPDSFFTDENKRLAAGTTMIRSTDFICPRCGDAIPTPQRKGQYPGALSRTDNLTEICSSCGTLEGLEQFSGGLMPQADWLRTPPGANPGSGKGSWAR